MAAGVGDDEQLPHPRGELDLRGGRGLRDRERGRERVVPRAREALRLRGRRPGMPRIGRAGRGPPVAAERHDEGGDEQDASREHPLGLAPAGDGAGSLRYRHCPATQLCGETQVTPHLPQFALSVWVLAQ